MEDEKENLSQSASFKEEYNILLRKVNDKFRVRDASWLEISESKASRVLSGKQFDILTLIDMACYCGYDVLLFFKTKINK